MFLQLFRSVYWPTMLPMPKGREKDDGNKNKAECDRYRYRCDFISSTDEFIRSIILCMKNHQSRIACHCGRYFGSLYPCSHARHRKKAGTPVSENKKAADRQMDQHHQLCSHPDLRCSGAGVGFNIADPGAGSVFSELVCTN